MHPYGDARLHRREWDVRGLMYATLLSMSVAKSSKALIANEADAAAALRLSLQKRTVDAETAIL